MTADTMANDMLTIFQNKMIDISNSLGDVNQNMRELENRQHILEGKLSEVEYAIRYLEQYGVETSQ